MRNGSFHYGAAVLLLSAAATAAVVAYGVTPLARRGLSFEADADRAAAVAGRAAAVYSFSEWVFADDSRRLVLTRLTPALARRLAPLRVEVKPLRDLPGLLPLVLLASLGVVGLWRGARGGDEARARDWVVLLLVAPAAVEFYLWVWTVAADYDLTAPFRGAGPRRRAPDFGLDGWLRTVPLQAAMWLAAMAVLCKLVWDGLGRPFAALLVAGFHAALAAGVYLMFRPDPYFRFPALSWWPLLFSLALLVCGLACVRAARSLAARAPEASG